ncbi:Uncharacterised protein [Klebsiella michiganensis]|nr:Uncharacterised protein [Klebsiella michiganensis]
MQIVSIRIANMAIISNYLSHQIIIKFLTHLILQGDL